LGEIGECHLLGANDPPIHFVLDRKGRPLQALKLEPFRGRLVDFGATRRRLAVVLQTGAKFEVRVVEVGNSEHHDWCAPELPAGSDVDVINVFEDHGVITLHVIEHVKDESGRASSRVARWSLPASDTLTVRHELPDSRARSQFCAIDPRHTGSPQRFLVRASDCSERMAGSSELAVHDLLDGTSVNYPLGFGRSLARPVFVPRARSHEELGGWVVVPIYDAVHDASDVAIFDMREFPASPIARVRLPAVVSGRGHGLWVPHDPRGAHVFE
jgi:hypothetical protein